MTPQKELALAAASNHRPVANAHVSELHAPAARLTSGYRRNLLPDPLAYYEGQGLRLVGSRFSAWKTAACRFHGGSDSMRINTHNGAFVCMAGCGARGGDVLAYHMALQGLDFIQAAKQLGAWAGDDTQSPRHIRPTPLPARDALAVLAEEATLVAVEGSRIASGIAPTATDLERVRVAAGRINHILGVFV
jgi:hypothetical protein